MLYALRHNRIKRIALIVTVGGIAWPMHSYDFLTQVVESRGRFIVIVGPIALLFQQ